MTLTIELSEENASALWAQASVMGMTESGFVQQIISPFLEAALEPALPSPEERLRRCQAFPADLDPKTPVLSDEAMSRKAFTSRRGRGPCSWRQ